MGAADDYARRSDIDRLDRAVEGLRADLRNVERRGSDAREADNRTHSAEHKALKEHVDHEFEAHEAEHEREEEARGQKKDRSWTKLIALASAMGGVAAAWVTILNYLHSR